MTRHATRFGAYHLDPMPSQPQIAICHGLFVSEDERGHGLGHQLKKEQEAQLKKDLFDYALCTCDGGNAAQQAVLEKAGWNKVDTFHNSKTGGQTQVWGRRVQEISTSTEADETNSQEYGIWFRNGPAYSTLSERVDMDLARVLHGVYVNTDMAAHFVLDDLHEMARKALP